MEEIRPFICGDSPQVFYKYKLWIGIEKAFIDLCKLQEKDIPSLKLDDLISFISLLKGKIASDFTAQDIEFIYTYLSYEEFDRFNREIRKSHQYLCENIIKFLNPPS